MAAAERLDDVEDAERGEPGELDPEEGEPGRDPGAALLPHAVGQGQVEGDVEGQEDEGRVDDAVGHPVGEDDCRVEPLFENRAEETEEVFFLDFCSWLKRDFGAT